MDIHCPGLTVEIKSPGLLQDLLPAEDKSAVRGKGEEKVEFLRAQLKGLGIEADFASRGIDGQAADMEGFRGV